MKGDASKRNAWTFIQDHPAIATVTLASIGVASLVPGSTHAQGVAIADYSLEPTDAVITLADATPADYVSSDRSANERKLVKKVTALVNSQFGGNWKAAFDHYDANGNGIDNGELSKLLKAAGVGNGVTRGLWVDGVMDAVDANGNGRIQWSEFSSFLTESA